MYAPLLFRMDGAAVRDLLPTNCQDQWSAGPGRAFPFPMIRMATGDSTQSKPSASNRSYQTSLAEASRLTAILSDGTLDRNRAFNRLQWPFTEGTDGPPHCCSTTRW
jgi:hypothetical protein